MLCSSGSRAGGVHIIGPHVPEQVERQAGSSFIVVKADVSGVALPDRSDGPVVLVVST